MPTIFRFGRSRIRAAMSSFTKAAAELELGITEVMEAEASVKAKIDSLVEVQSDLIRSRMAAQSQLFRLNKLLGE